MNDEMTQRPLSLRAARLTPITSLPQSLALLTCCPPERIAWALEAAETAVRAGRPAADVLSALLEHLEDHPMPDTELDWILLAGQL